MLKVVLDTNVYISALIRGGLPLDILLAAIKGDFKLFVSDSILEELDGVFVQKLGWAPSRAKHALTTVQTYAELVFPKERLAVIQGDEDDNRILECAVAAEAHAIVTGDSDLLRLGAFRDITMLSPREFWEILRRRSGSHTDI